MRSECYCCGRKGIVSSSVDLRKQFVITVERKDILSQPVKTRKGTRPRSQQARNKGNSTRLNG